MRVFQLPPNPLLVVVSDVHVRTEHDDRYMLLCQLVEEALEVRARSLVLNGDIFDFFFGWGKYFRCKYHRLFDGLDQLVSSGALVWFVIGNHEFGLEGLSGHYKFDVIPSEGRIWTSPEAQKILIAHGDLLRSDPWYNLFRTLVRSRAINVMALLFPQRWLDSFTLWFASTSRKKDKYRVLNHEKIVAGAVQKLHETQADSIIFGHFHHPYDEDLGQGRRLLSVTSWDSPSCLVMKDDGMILRVYPK